MERFSCSEKGRSIHQSCNRPWWSQSMSVFIPTKAHQRTILRPPLISCRVFHLPYINPGNKAKINFKIRTAVAIVGVIREMPAGVSDFGEESCTARPLSVEVVSPCPHQLASEHPIRGQLQTRVCGENFIGSGSKVKPREKHSDRRFLANSRCARSTPIRAWS